MKTKNIFKLIAFFLIVGFATSCVQDDEYTIPQLGNTVEPDLSGLMASSIQGAKDAWTQNYNANNEAIFTFQNDANLYLTGYVVSSDYAGNNYKSLIIQDTPSNPSGGIEVMVNKTSLFETYDFGRKVYIKLAGLSVTYEDGRNNDPADTNNPGRFLIGVDTGGQVDQISQFDYSNIVLRSPEVATIDAMPIAMEDFSEANINTFIQLQNVQFELNEIGKTFSAGPSDSFDGFRNLISCDTDGIAMVQTSTFADFSAAILPEMKGNFNAVLQKDYRARNYVLVINTPTDIDFTNTDRCDPLLLDCGTNAVGGTNVVFDEQFDGSSISQLITEGWINVNVNGGSNDYRFRTFSGNSYMQASAFRSGESPMEVWLVTPAINLDSSTDEELTFDTKVGYYNGDALSVYVSTDFSGDVTTATWALINATYPTGPTSGYGTSFTPSGSINLSCLNGDVYVAFKYKGGDGGITTTFQIDNVKVTGN